MARRTNQIYAGRMIVCKGAHITNRNSGEIGIVRIGNFDAGCRSLFAGDGWDGDPVQTAMLASRRHPGKTPMATFPIRSFGGHI